MFEVLRAILLALRREFCGLSRLVGNVGKLMADRVTRLVDEERGRGKERLRRNTTLDQTTRVGSYIFRPLFGAKTDKENRNSLRVGEAGTLLLTFTLDPFT